MLVPVSVMSTRFPLPAGVTHCAEVAVIQRELRHCVPPTAMEIAGLAAAKFEPAIETIETPDVGALPGDNRVRTGASKEKAACAHPVREVTMAATTTADPVPAPAVHRANVVVVHDDVAHVVTPRTTDIDSSLAPKFIPVNCMLPNPVVGVFAVTEVPNGAS